MKLSRTLPEMPAQGSESCSRCHLAILAWAGYFQETAGSGEALKTESKVPFCKKTFSFIREISIGRGVSLLCTRKKNDSKSLEMLINGEDKDLNLYNNLTLVCCALPGNLP